MGKKLFNKFHQLQILFFLILLSASCATFPRKELAIIDKLPSIESSHKPSIYIDVGLYDPSIGKRYKPGSFLQPYARNMERIVRKITEESNLFNSYTFDESNAKEVDFSFVMTLRFYGLEKVISSSVLYQNNGDGTFTSVSYTPPDPTAYTLLPAR
jgi:hypothetical protein